MSNAPITIAIDFGTTNTYIVTCPQDSINPIPVMPNANTAGIDTVVLYSNEADSPHIGAHAIQWYGMSSDADKEKYAYNFCSSFKPDIANGNEKVRNAAIRNAADFLKTLLRESHKQNLPFFPAQNNVIFGVPSEANVQFRDTLKHIAKDAGYGDVGVMDEPIGAMLECVSSGQYSLRDIIEGLLVIDFGGGTCDFAFLRNGKVEHSWGDMFLGGRLFDDLFYRWYCDQNPDKSFSENPTFFLRTCKCCEAKEKFSDFMTHTRNKPYTAFLDQFGKIDNLTWAEFEDRAKNYSRTTEDIPLPQDAVSGKVDLLAWFRRVLKSGLQDKNISPNDIKLVILAGGSSLWSFVADICREEFRTDKIHRAQHPYESIAKGLAIHPALQDKLQRTRAALKQENWQKDLRAQFQDTTARLKETMVDEIVKALFERLEPIFKNFHNKGGTINSLEDSLKKAAADYEPKASSIVHRNLVELMQHLSIFASGLTENLFKKHNLRWTPILTPSAGQGGITFPAINVNMGESIANVIQTAVGAVMAVIVANICGGGGMALLASGPMGWFLGLILGAAGAIAVAWLGKGAAENAVKSFSLPANISPIPGFQVNPLDAVLPNIQSLQDQTRASLMTKIEVELDKTLNNLLLVTENAVEDEIKRLDVVNVPIG